MHLPYEDNGRIMVLFFGQCMNLTNKRYVITGIASKLSIAYAIAGHLKAQGAQLILTYPNDKLKARVEQAAQIFEAVAVLQCDVASDASIAQLLEDVSTYWDGIDGLVHSIGFAPADQLDGDFTQATTREGFAVAHDISSYSLIALAKAFSPLLKVRQGAILTLTYEGATQVLPNYNVMGLAKASLEAAVRYLAASLGQDGIRVNAISAGPIRTLAASGIKSFRQMLNASEKIAPLKRNVTQEEVARAATFLLSDWASGITAEILFVDAGFHAVAISAPLMEAIKDI